MDFKLNVQSSPHVRDSISTRMIMLDVIIALLPATIWGIIVNSGKMVVPKDLVEPVSMWDMIVKSSRIHIVLVILLTVLAAIVSETVFNVIVKRKNTVGDLSCVVTGLILALNMPPQIPLFIPIIGAVFAIIITKMLFGGLGQNFMNPALAGRCFLLISFTSQMTDFNSNRLIDFTTKLGVDATTSATPLYIMKNNLGTPHLLDMFLGYIPGTIGEVSALCLLIGAIYLLVKKVISIQIPLVYILSFVIFIMLFSGRIDANYILGQILGGGLIFGAFFMATDYVTSPVTPLGRTIFAIFLGVMTGVFRLWGKAPESTSYVILLGNILVPLIESFTIPRAFGKEGK